MVNNGSISQDTTLYAYLDDKNPKLKQLVEATRTLGCWDNFKQPGLLAVLFAGALGVVLMLVGFLVPPGDNKTQLDVCLYFGLALVAGAVLMLASIYIFKEINLTLTKVTAY